MDTLCDFFARVPDLSPWAVLAFYVFSFFASGLTAVAGLGGGLLMLAVLAAVYPPGVTIPVHSVIQLGSNGGRAMVMFRHVMWQMVPVFFIGCAIGAAVGARIYVELPTAFLQAAIGIFVLYMIWGPAIRAFSSSRPTFFGLGVVVSFASLFVGVTGPLLAPFVAAASGDRRSVVSTHAAMMTLQHLAKILAFGAIGFAFGPYLGFIVGMIATGFLGTLAGGYVLYRIPERTFRFAFKTVMTLLALRLLINAVV